jgi:transcriptional regulator with XRE-family HTH domain
MRKKKDEYTRRVDAIVGNRIKKLRTFYKIPRKEFAPKIKVSQQQLLKYEKGIDTVNSGQLMMIARALNRPTSYFFLEVEQQPRGASSHDILARNE